MGNSRFLAYFVFGLWIISSNLQALRAEGTKELMPPSGSCISYVQGNDGSGKEGATYGRPRTDLIYVRVVDPATEIIYYGFRVHSIANNRSLYYTILDPDSQVVVRGKVGKNNSDSCFIPNDGFSAYIGPSQIHGSGYAALEVKPQKAGDYMIMFNVDDIDEANPSQWNKYRYFVHPFDVTVADVSDPGNPAEVPGRLFSYKWHLNTNSSSNQACMSFFTWTSDSLVVRMDMNGMQPWGYSVSFNSHGSTNTGDIVEDRKSTKLVSETVPEYPVFINDPDPAGWPTGTPGQITYIDIHGCDTIYNYCILANATKAGEVNVYIDLDGNGTYEEGGQDVYFPFHNTEIGNICIPWDGYDGFGNLTGPGSSGTVFVQFLAGVVHFPVYDPENNPNGFTCAVTSPIGMDPLMYFDNRNTSIGTVNLDGCPIDCNIWTGNKGDKVMVNTWLNTITSRDTASFTIGSLCPPMAVDDYACTTPLAGIQFHLTANDLDMDNQIDPYSLIYFPPDDFTGELSYDPENDLMTFIPDPNDTSDVETFYIVCDNTPMEDGGPLCDDANIYIEVYDGCPTATVLAGESCLLSWEAGAPPWLRWQVSPGVQVSRFELWQAPPNGPLDLVGTYAPGRVAHVPQGYGLPVPAGVSGAMQIRAIDQAGRILPSNWITLAEQDNMYLNLRPNPAKDQLKLDIATKGPAQLTIYNAQLQPVYQRSLNQEEATGQHTLSLEGWESGLYFVRLQGNAQYRMQSLIRL